MLPLMGKFSKPQPPLKPMDLHLQTPLLRFLPTLFSTVIQNRNDLMNRHNNTFDTSSKFLLENWKKERRNFSLTWVCSSIKHSWMFFNTSMLSWEHMEPPVQESVLVPSLLWSQSEVSLSLTVAILALWLHKHSTLPYWHNFLFKIPC